VWLRNPSQWQPRREEKGIMYDTAERKSRRTQGEQRQKTREIRHQTRDDEGNEKSGDEDETRD